MRSIISERGRFGSGSRFALAEPAVFTLDCNGFSPDDARRGR